MKVELFRSTWNAWIQNHVPYSYISEETLLKLGLKEEDAKVIAEVYSVNVNEDVDEPSMLVYRTGPHTDSAYYAQFIMIGDEETVKAALEKIAEMLRDDDDNLDEAELEIAEELGSLFDPESECKKVDDVETVIVSGPCDVTFTVP